MQKILAIDDKMDNLVTLSALLKNLMPDCAVITAQSGREGIEKAEAELPDIILLDVKMPEMDGFETCRRLMDDERTKHVPVIMITAIDTDQQSRIKALDIGANSFLAKPIDEAELISQVKVALRIKKAEDALREERDSLERKIQERTDDLRQSEDIMHYIVKHSPNAIAVYDVNLHYIAVSNRYLQDYDVKEEVIIGKHHYEVFPEMPQRWKDMHQRCLAGAIECSDDDYFERPDGSIICNRWECRPWYRTNGKIGGVITYTEVITEWKKAEAALRDAETRYRMLFEHSPDGILIIDPATARPLEFNETAHRQLGYSREEFSGLSIFDLEASETTEETQLRIAQVIQEGRVDFETRQRTRKGEIRNVHVTAQIVEVLGRPVYHCVWRNITDRRRAEEKYEMLFREMLDGFALHDVFCNEEGRPTDYRFLAVNPAFERITGLKAKEIVGRTVMEVLPGTERHWIETYGNVALTGEPVFFENYSAEMKKYFEVTAFQTAPKQFACIFADITNRKQAEEKLKNTLESLKKAVNATIQVMVSAVEARDPYTAGHQTRSANLAHAIAVEMGLSQDQIDGIRMAGSIHDIGKLSIPAEILSKPTKLTGVEFSLIKEHAQRGFDILKDVESPWPLAEIVLQHHERKDGSGYPRNLKGDEILMEARILGVADVVESMASHRPYRAGLGIDAALEEIENNRGIFYDAEVVDTCLKLFRIMDYKL